MKLRLLSEMAQLQILSGMTILQILSEMIQVTSTDFK